MFVEIESERCPILVISRRAHFISQPEVQCQPWSYFPVVLEIRRVLAAAKVIPGPAEHRAVVHGPKLEVGQSESGQRPRKRVRGCRGRIVERCRQSGGAVLARTWKPRLVQVI